MKWTSLNICAVTVFVAVALLLTGCAGGGGAGVLSVDAVPVLVVGVVNVDATVPALELPKPPMAEVLELLKTYGECSDE